MVTHRTACRVIYGDTDKMGVAYHSNYLRWFEMGRAELFRSLGLSYKALESQGFFLPVSEVYCKFLAGAQYDEVLGIEATIDESVRAGLKFDYTIFSEDGEKVLARGYTKHAFTDENGRVVRPPQVIKRALLGGEKG
jgi:acyl-CoA thioester hydrolase